MPSSPQGAETRGVPPIGSLGSSLHNEPLSKRREGMGAKGPPLGASGFGKFPEEWNEAVVDPAIF